eukprot:101673_1
MSCNKAYGDNFISDRSSTKVIQQPGGKSSIGSLLFGGGSPNELNKPNKENKNSENQPKLKLESNVNEQTQCTKCKCTDCWSDAEKVREFTFEAGQTCPDKPQLMKLDEVNFITKMIIDELLELYSTVLSPQMAKAEMNKMVHEAKSVPKMNVTPNFTHKLIAEQGDALVDIYYYSLNCMAKKGVNVSKIFNLVHAANMAKRDPKTGKFLKRNDGKIIKPSGWRAPDVSEEIKRQMEQGSWQ